MCYPRYDSPTGKIIGWPYLGKTKIVDEIVDECAENVLRDLKIAKISIVRRYFVKKVLNALKKELGHGWFEEGADAVDSQVASLLYAADRLYHKKEIEYLINQGSNVVIDRYVYSNFAHQGGKKETPEERNAISERNESLEFGFLSLSPADLKIFLHMPTEYANLVKTLRAKKEELDEHEKDSLHLLHAERAYLEIAKNMILVPSNV